MMSRLHQGHSACDQPDWNKLTASNTELEGDLVDSELESASGEVALSLAEAAALAGVGEAAPVEVEAASVAVKAPLVAVEAASGAVEAASVEEAAVDVEAPSLADEADVQEIGYILQSMRRQRDKADSESVDPQKADATPQASADVPQIAAKSKLQIPNSSASSKAQGLAALLQMDSNGDGVVDAAEFVAAGGNLKQVYIACCFILHFVCCV